jgi:hypothetical protein
MCIFVQVRMEKGGGGIQMLHHGFLLLNGECFLPSPVILSIRISQLDICVHICTTCMCEIDSPGIDSPVILSLPKAKNIQSSKSSINMSNHWLRVGLFDCWVGSVTRTQSVSEIPLSSDSSLFFSETSNWYIA